MTAKVVVFIGPTHCTEIVQRVLGAMFEVRCVEATPDSLYPALQGCTALLDASMKVPITREQIERAKHLKLIATATTGCTHIDEKALSRQGVTLFTLKGQYELLQELTPAAELTWALVLACARHLRTALKHVERGKWDREQFPGLMLNGKTIGIVGMGRIGGWVARYATAFGMQVLFYDPNVLNAEIGQRMENLEGLFASSDVITLHVHVDNTTRGMVDRALINKAKHGAVLVNTSRGEILDENALIDALASERLRAVGLDVLQSEPDITQSDLWSYARKHDNVLITPHMGGYSPDAVAKVVEFASHRIYQYFQQSG